MKRFGRWLASFLWSFVNATVRAVVKSGVVQRVRLPSRVVSVGNIQAGGAGKTPLAALIAREAAALGQSVCILCRGYKGKWEQTGGVMPPLASAPDLPRVSDCGDEALLLRELSPGAWIGVGKRRAHSFEEAIRQHGKPFDLVILDDGFQQFGIQKDLEIVLLTSKTCGEVAYRDFKSSLSAADLLVWTKGGVCPAVPVQKPWVRIQMGLDLKVVDSRPVFLITGIADGKSVSSLLNTIEIKIKRHVQLRDHARYSRSEVGAWLTQAQAEGTQLVLTGKDWVKWRELGVARDQVTVLEPEIKFIEGKEIWNRLLWGN